MITIFPDIAKNIIDLPQEIHFTRCKRHPKYKALKSPRANCARCWRIYDAAQVNKVIFELKAMMGEIQSIEERAIGTINREASKVFRSAFEAALKVAREEAKEYIKQQLSGQR